MLAEFRNSSLKDHRKLYEIKLSLFKSIQFFFFKLVHIWSRLNAYSFSFLTLPFVSYLLLSIFYVHI